MKKSQAAMEFLMTYGWAILIVLGAVGILAYTGVIKPKPPEICEFYPILACTESPTTSASTNGGQIIIPVSNSLYYDIENVYATSPDCTPSAAISIDKAETGILELDNCGFLEGDNYKMKVTIYYETSVSDGGSGLAHSVTGYVRGVVRP